MDQPHSPDQTLNSEIIDLTDIVEVGHKPGQQTPTVDPDDDILDLDALLEQVEANDAVATANAPSNSDLPLPDMSDLHDLLGQAFESQTPPDAFGAELDAMLAEVPVASAPDQEEIALDDLDDLLASISPPETVKPSDENVVDVNDLDSLLDSIMNPEPDHQATAVEQPQPVAADSECVSQPDLHLATVMDLPEESIIESAEPQVEAAAQSEEPAVPAPNIELESLLGQVAGLQDRLEELAGTTATQAQTVKDDLLSRLDKMQTEVQEMAESNALGLAAAEARIAALETELATLATAASSENGLVDLDARLTSLETSLADPGATVSAERLTDLESKLTAQVDGANSGLQTKLVELECQLRQELEAKLAPLAEAQPDQALQDRLAALEAKAQEVQAAKDLEAKDLEVLQNRINALENAPASPELQDLNERLQTLEQLANPDLEIRLARLEEKIVAAQAEPASLEQRLAQLESRLTNLESNMEQAAAASAAKVIREEMANLLSDDD